MIFSRLTILSQEKYWKKFRKFMTWIFMTASAMPQTQVDEHQNRQRFLLLITAIFILLQLPFNRARPIIVPAIYSIFTIYFRYSAVVVAPMHLIVPLARAGFKILPASMAPPPAAPAAIACIMAILNTVQQTIVVVFFVDAISKLFPHRQPYPCKAHSCIDL